MATIDEKEEEEEEQEEEEDMGRNVDGGREKIAASALLREKFRSFF